MAGPGIPSEREHVHSLRGQGLLEGVSVSLPASPTTSDQRQCQVVPRPSALDFETPPGFESWLCHCAILGKCLPSLTYLCLLHSFVFIPAPPSGLWGLPPPGTVVASLVDAPGVCSQAGHKGGRQVCLLKVELCSRRLLSPGGAAALITVWSDCVNPRYGN